jgi:valyl-tRNA synthetase
VWSWWKEGSVHRAAWPAEAELAGFLHGVSDDDQEKWSYAREVLGEVRKRRSEAKQPLKVPIVRAVIADTAARLAHLDAVEADLRAAVRIDAIERKPAGALAIEVEFGVPPAA